MKLNLHILAQAMEDVLRFETGLPLVGCPLEDEELVYMDALAFIYRYPTLAQKLSTKKHCLLDKMTWLKEIEHARS